MRSNITIRALTVRALSVAAFATLLPAMNAGAQAPVSDPRQVEMRLNQLERSLSGSSLVQLHQTLQNLEREVRQLRGDLEEQTHTIEQLKRGQGDLYKDIDQRVQALETGATGQAPSAAQAPLSPPAGNDPNAAVLPPQPPAGTASTQDPAEEQKAYREAFDQLKGGKFTEASSALTEFLAKYPNGRFADNAQYWLGEANYVSRKFGPALTAFEKLLVDYPDSPKRSHSMLKIGFIHDESGQPDQARKMLNELIKQYPKSTAASLAEKRLKRLQ